MYQKNIKLKKKINMNFTVDEKSKKVYVVTRTSASRWNKDENIHFIDLKYFISESSTQ